MKTRKVFLELKAADYTAGKFNIDVTSLDIKKPRKIAILSSTVKLAADSDYVLIYSRELADLHKEALAGTNTGFNNLAYTMVPDSRITRASSSSSSVTSGVLDTKVSDISSLLLWLDFKPARGLDASYTEASVTGTETYHYFNRSPATSNLRFVHQYGLGLKLAEVGEAKGVTRTGTWKGWLGTVANQPAPSEQFSAHFLVTAPPDPALNSLLFYTTWLKIRFLNGFIEFVQKSGSIENVLNPETIDEHWEGMQLALPEGFEEEEEAYNQLSIYLENQVVEQAGGLDIKSFNELQEAAAKFYKLPRIGEIVMVRALGAYIVNDLTWNADKELAIVCTHITSGETILIPLSDLTLTPAGTWKRESLGFVENAQDAVGMMKGIARFGINSLAVFKYKDFFRIARIVAPEWLHHGEWNRYFNSFLYAMVGIIPLGGFDTAWDYLVGGWQNNFDIMTVRDPSLPLGQREYYNAITGQSSTVSKQKGMLSTAWENTKDFLTGAVEITSSVVDKTTETVTSLFYGAAILGSMAIVYKFVS